MDKLLSCRYNMDTNRVEARFKAFRILTQCQNRANMNMLTQCQHFMQNICHNVLEVLL